jgi:iron complex transport system substrate-binding protein
MMKWDQAIILLLMVIFCIFSGQPLLADIDTMDKGPERIISLGPFITEELYLLGVQDRLVACTTYCTRPAAAIQKPRVSNAVRPNVEKILSLRPDLVLVPELIDTRPLGKMKQLGLKVRTFPVARSFNEICTIFLEIGNLVGKEAQARTIINQARGRIAELQARLSACSTVKVFFQIGANPLFTVIRNTFMNDYITLIKGSNIAGEANSAIFSREAVVKLNPDVIIIVTMGNIHLQERQTWMTFSSINAVKNRRIHILDAERVCSATPMTFVEVLEELAPLLHPRIQL